MFRSLLSSALVLSSAMLFSTGAHAQTTTDNRDEARQAFQRGQAAADGGRWDDALREFEQAYLMSGVPTALFNAGMALRALGRHREARDTFARLIESHPDSPASEQARALRDEEAARVAVLELAGFEPGAAYELRVDGRRVEVEVQAVTEVEVDPGQHGLSAERQGYETFTWEGRLGDGERRRLQIVMRELEVPDGEERSIAKSPWLWIAVAAVVVGAGIGVGIFLKRNAQLEPAFPDNLFEL